MKTCELFLMSALLLAGCSTKAEESCLDLHDQIIIDSTEYSKPASTGVFWRAIQKKIANPSAVERAIVKCKKRSFLNKATPEFLNLTQDVFPELSNWGLCKSCVYSEDSYLSVQGELSYNIWIFNRKEAAILEVYGNGKVSQSYEAISSGRE